MDRRGFLISAIGGSLAASIGPIRLMSSASTISMDAAALQTYDVAAARRLFTEQLQNHFSAMMDEAFLEMVTMEGRVQNA